MRIYFAHSRELDFRKELYEPIRNSRLDKLHEIILPHEKAEFNSKAIIKNCDLLIAEVSFPSTGLGIELGWADSFGVPVICIFRKGSKISGSLKAISEKFIEYSGAEEMLAKIEECLIS